MTKSTTAAADIQALLRARNPLIWITSKEEARVERYLAEAAASAGYTARTWDCAAGVRPIVGTDASFDGTNDIGQALAAVTNRAGLDPNAYAQPAAERGVWIMRDVPVWLQGPVGMVTLRQLRNLARALPGVERGRAQAMVVLSPEGTIPPELANHAVAVDWPLPDREEIASILDATIDSLPDEIRASAAPNGTRDAAIDAAVGLSGEEAQACYARSLVQLRRIDPKIVANEKKRIIAREKVLTWVDPLKGGLDAVGGLGNVKAWLKGRAAAYSPRARAYGLPAPKGLLLVGIPGCGKTFVAKAIATYWGVPLLLLDLGALKGKFVGESEGNLRKALATIAAIGRCVVLIDEIEKALAGATQGAADGGVSADALGSLLSWMQDRQGEAFVIATSNDISKLPPELYRKGRWDDLFFVDLPTTSERAQVLDATLTTHGRKDHGVDLAQLAGATEGFSGAEIASLVPDAMFAAFAENERAITTNDLLASARNVVPLATTAAERLQELRSWASTRARRASEPEAQAPTKTLRALDLG